MRVRSRWLLCGVFLALAVSLGWPASTTPVSAQATTGAVGGSVRDRETGEPIYGLLLRLYVLEGDKIVGKYGTTSYASGEFRFNDVAPGQYRLSYSDSLRGRYLWGWYDGADTFETATPITVVAGQNTILTSIEPERAGLLRIRVDDEGLDLGLGQLRLYDLDTMQQAYPATGPSLIDDHIVFSGLGSGRYTIGYGIRENFDGGRGEFGNATGGYYNRKTSLSAADPITITAGMTTTVTLDLTQLDSEISGTVYDAQTRQPIPRLQVYFLNEQGEQIGAATTVDDGTYRWRYLNPGTYTIIFSGVISASICGKGCADTQRYESRMYSRIVVGPEQAVTGFDGYLLPLGQQFGTQVFLPLIAR